MSSTDIPPIETVLTEIRELLTEDGESPEDGDNLIEWGLDSITLMRLASGWRRAGIEVSFGALAADPTLGAWRALLADAAPAPVVEEVTEEIPSCLAGTPDFALAPLQHAYWIGRQEGQQWGGVAAHLYTEFDGVAVDPERLTRAVHAVLRRHPMLRATICGDGTQRVLPERAQPPIVLVDLRDAAPDRIEASLAEIRDRRSHQLLDIEAGEVFQLGLTLLPEGRGRVHLDVDMVAGDARSYRMLLADLARAYHQDSDLGDAAEYEFARYLAEHGKLESPAVARDAAWWAERLADQPGAPDLPIDPLPADPSRIGRRLRWLSAEDRDRLTEQANRRGVTLAMALATAYAEVIGGWSANNRFLLNLPLFDREPLHPDVAGLVGDFTSSVLLDIDLRESAPFATRAAQLQAQLHERAEHAAFSGVHLLRELTRARGEQVVAPVVFTSALGLGELFDPLVLSEFGEPVWIISQGPQVLLDAQITELHGGVLVNWDVRENLLRPGVADAMFDAFTRLVDRLTDDPTAWDASAAAELLPDSQREVRDRVNDTAADIPARCLHDGFFARATQTPDAPALLWGESGVWTYAEVADRALRVAAALWAKGMQPGNVVGVHLPKGPEQVTVILGVLAAGGTYLPIGWDQPERRLDAILTIAGARLLVTDRELPGRTGTLPSETVLAWPMRADAPASPDPSSTAYLLFTSGSTGEPKGVQVPHAAAMNTIDDLLPRCGIGPTDRALGVSAMEFDLSVFDVFGLLSVGGAVVVVTEEERRDAREWVRLVRERGVTVLNCVPALLDMLLVTARGAGPENGLGDALRIVLLGGDWVGVDLPGRLYEQVPGCRFVGLGGTTETAIHSTWCEVTGGVTPADWRAVPYGVPLHNVACRVADEQGHPRPDWAVGELWIGGSGVADGYRGDPVRTAEKFVERDGVRWYRTGDLARYWPGGMLEFLGRADHQVKLRGYRVELGEVEAALAAQPGVRRAVARLSTKRGGSLQAVVAGDDALTDEVLRAGISDLVPAYMVPDLILVRAEIPLTRNGKPNRTAVAALLDAHTGADSSTEPTAPRNALEEVLLVSWREVLGDLTIGVEDAFLTRGGDSVLAARIVAALRESLQSDAIRVRDIFTGRTVAAMAASMLAEDPAWSQIAEIALEVARLSDADIEEALKS